LRKRTIQALDNIETLTQHKKILTSTLPVVGKTSPLTFEMPEERQIQENMDANRFIGNLSLITEQSVRPFGKLGQDINAIQNSFRLSRLLLLHCLSKQQTSPFPIGQFKSTNQVEAESKSISNTKDNPKTALPLESAKFCENRKELEEQSTNNCSQFPMVEPPPLTILTKEFPDWDLGKIAEFINDGKTKDDIVSRELRSNKRDVGQEDVKKKRIETEDEISEEELTEKISLFSINVKNLFGFAEVKQEKIFSTLCKNDFDTRKAFTLIKKNRAFYRKYFQLEQNSDN
jgi:hypothetical protein